MSGNSSQALLWLACIVAPIAYRRINDTLAKRRAAARNASSSWLWCLVPRPTLLPSLGPWYRPSALIPLLLSACVVLYHLASLLPAPLAPFLHSHLDVFRRLRLPVHVPTSVLRARVSDYLAEGRYDVLLPRDRGDWNDDAVETLLNRLGAWEGRRLYLIVGAAPLLDCAFCTQPSDFGLYALLGSSRIYVSALILLGLVTAPRSAYRLVDRAFGFGRPRDPAVAAATPGTAPAPAPADAAVEEDRSAWRLPAAALVLVMALAEAALLCTKLAVVSKSPSVLNHWHTNIHHARHSVLLLVALSVQLFPSRPAPSSLHRLAVALASCNESVGAALTTAQASRLHRRVLREDEPLRRRHLEHLAVGDGDAHAVEGAHAEGRAREDLDADEDEDVGDEYLITAAEGARPASGAAAGALPSTEWLVRGAQRRGVDVAKAQSLALQAAASVWRDQEAGRTRWREARARARAEARAGGSGETSKAGERSDEGERTSPGAAEAAATAAKRQDEAVGPGDAAAPTDEATATKTTAAGSTKPPLDGTGTGTGSAVSSGGLRERSAATTGGAAGADDA